MAYWANTGTRNLGWQQVGSEPAEVLNDVKRNNLSVPRRTRAAVFELPPVVAGCSSISIAVASPHSVQIRSVIRDGLRLSALLTEMSLVVQNLREPMSVNSSHAPSNDPTLIDRFLFNCRR